jgi:hypothetical protein
MYGHKVVTHDSSSSDISLQKLYELWVSRLQYINWRVAKSITCLFLYITYNIHSLSITKTFSQKKSIAKTYR